VSSPSPTGGAETPVDFPSGDEGAKARHEYAMAAIRAVENQM